MQNDMTPCKIHWCVPKRAERTVRLRDISGDCLEELGIPSSGKAVINCTLMPRVGDLVHCNRWTCALGGYIKQVESFDKDEMIVRTRYIDHRNNFKFYCFEFYGVVEMVFNNAGEIVYQRDNSSYWTLHADGSGTCHRCNTTQKHVWDFDNWQNYCGHCGAKMVEKRK